MGFLNMQVGYPIVPLSELIPLDEFKYSASTMTRYLPKIMVEAGIVKSTSEVYRNRPDLCRTYPDDMTTCEEIKWGKKRLYIVVGKKYPTDFNSIWKDNPNVNEWYYKDTYGSILEFYNNPENHMKPTVKFIPYYGICIVRRDHDYIVADGIEYRSAVVVGYNS